MIGFTNLLDDLLYRNSIMTFVRLVFTDTANRSTCLAFLIKTDT